MEKSNHSPCLVSHKGSNYLLDLRYLAWILLTSSAGTVQILKLKEQSCFMVKALIYMTTVYASTIHGLFRGFPTLNPLWTPMAHSSMTCIWVLIPYQRCSIASADFLPYATLSLQLCFFVSSFIMLL